MTKTKSYYLKVLLSHLVFPYFCIFFKRSLQHLLEQENTFKFNIPFQSSQGKTFNRVIFFFWKRCSTFPLFHSRNSLTNTPHKHVCLDFFPLCIYFTPLNSEFCYVLLFLFFLIKCPPFLITHFFPPPMTLADLVPVTYLSNVSTDMSFLE